MGLRGKKPTERTTIRAGVRESLVRIFGSNKRAYRNLGLDELNFSYAEFCRIVTGWTAPVLRVEFVELTWDRYCEEHNIPKIESAIRVPESNESIRSREAAMRKKPWSTTSDHDIIAELNYKGAKPFKFHED